MPLSNSVVLLTGVGREGQVGEVVARAFAERGASLVLVDRREEQASSRASVLRRDGNQAWGYGCDLSDPAAVASLAQRVRTERGDALAAFVHLAGGFSASGPVADSDLEVWNRMFAVNLTTAYLCTRAFLPLLRVSHGAIVYFASEAVLPGGRVAELAGYAAAKSGVLSLMRSVAQEERKSGVRANAVAPTAIRTGDNVKAMGENVRYVEREAVADAVVYLCSDEAHAVTGQVIALS